jgi:hypothetical protein
MRKISAGNFTVRCDVKNVSGSAAELRVSAPATYEVSVENRTTLAYDIEVHSLFPDDRAARALSFRNAPHESWTCRWGQVAALQRVSGEADLDVHGEARRNQRIHLERLRYRLANPGFAPDQGGLWQSLGSAYLPLAIQIKVTG